MKNQVSAFEQRSTRALNCQLYRCNRSCLYYLRHDQCALNNKGTFKIIKLCNGNFKPLHNVNEQQGLRLTSPEAIIVNN